MAQRIVPMIAYEDAAAAIDWLSEAFGFAERAEHRYTDENGVVGHAELELGGEIVMLATPNRADHRHPLFAGRCLRTRPVRRHPAGHPDPVEHAD